MMTLSTIGPARPTYYAGIRMRSRLEARMAAEFDSLGWPWEYEPFALAARSVQWLPDFRLTIGPEVVYVEVKGAEPTDREALLDRISDTVWANFTWDANAALLVGSDSLLRPFDLYCPGIGWANGALVVCQKGPEYPVSIGLALPVSLGRICFHCGEKLT